MKWENVGWTIELAGRWSATERPERVQIGQSWAADIGQLATAKNEIFPASGKCLDFLSMVGDELVSWLRVSHKPNSMIWQQTAADDMCTFYDGNPPQNLFSSDNNGRGHRQ